MLWIMCGNPSKKNVSSRLLKKAEKLLGEQRKNQFLNGTLTGQNPIFVSDDRLQNIGNR
jgi:hypothetical protein